MSAPGGSAPPPDDSGDALGPLAALAADPGASGVVTDFDGTLAPIVEDPESALALPGVPAVLGALAGRMAVVAVVSGRPAPFLAERLAAAGPGVRLVGAYGLEWIEDGELRRAPRAEAWRDPTRRVVDAARAEFGGQAVGVEDKGASVTIHWRRAPEAGPRARAFAREWALRAGFDLQPGRRAVELRPPLGIDKGTAVAALLARCRAGCFMGDDAGDVAAFAALDALAAAGAQMVRVAVGDAETPPELIEAADVVVDGPHEALALLAGLLERLEGAAP